MCEAGDEHGPGCSCLGRRGGRHGDKRRGSMIQYFQYDIPSIPHSFAELTERLVIPLQLNITGCHKVNQTKLTGSIPGVFKMGGVLL